MMMLISMEIRITPHVKARPTSIATTIAIASSILTPYMARTCRDVKGNGFWYSLIRECGRLIRIDGLSHTHAFGS
jgi:hypothetical protein